MNLNLKIQSSWDSTYSNKIGKQDESKTSETAKFNFSSFLSFIFNFLTSKENYFKILSIQTTKRWRMNRKRKTTKTTSRTTQMILETF